MAKKKSKKNNKSNLQKKQEKVSTSVLKNSHKKTIFVAVGAIVIVLLLILFFTQLFEKKAANGDTVSLDYTGYLDNGSVFDTSIESIGLEAGLTKAAYEPISFTLGEGRVIPGFEETIVGMSVGEKKTFTVTSDKGYGEVRQDLIVSGLRKKLEITRFSVINTTVFKNLFNTDPVVGAIVTRAEIPWQMRVFNVSDESVYVESALGVGDKVELPNVEWGTTVVGVNESVITFMQDPHVGERIMLPMGGGALTGVVVALHEDTFDVDANHPLAGKNLTFEVELKSIEGPEN